MNPKRTLVFVAAIACISFFAYRDAKNTPVNRRYVALSTAVEYAKRPVNIAFVNAAGNGDFNTVKRLLEQGVSPDSIDGSSECGEGEALEAAAANGNIAVVKLLLEHGADINAPDRMGGTVLVSAVAQKDVVKLLLSKGADVDVFCDGATVLQWAKIKGDKEVVKLLKQAGARD